MSTATSNISPSTARTSFPCGRRTCACRPRSVPRTECEWLSCTNGPGMPPARYLSRWYVSRKKPRGSRCTSGSTTMTPGSAVSRNFTARPRPLRRSAPGTGRTRCAASSGRACSTSSAPMKPSLNAISSGQATFRPWRCSIAWMKFDACSSASCVPVSSQAMPRPSTSTCRSPHSRYARFTSVISSSPRGDGFEVGGHVEHAVVVEVEPGDRVGRLRLRRLLLEADRAARLVELDDAVALRVAHAVGEHGGARLRAAPRAA